MAGGLGRKVRPLPGKPGPAPIDLAFVDPAIWQVQSGGEARGPFTLGQIQQFVIEGRLSAASLLSGGDGQPFRPIRETPRLAESLAPAFAERARRRAEACNYVITIHAPAIDAAALEQALAALGKWLQPLPGTFLLRSGKSLADVRAALANALPEDAQAVVLQARDAQLTGIGFDQDLAETARPVWNAPLS